MSELKIKIESIKTELKNALAKIQNIKDLENLRVQFLGKKGTIISLLSELKTLSVEDKKIFGPLLNQLKRETEEKIQVTTEPIEEVEDIGVYKPEETEEKKDKKYNYNFDDFEEY